MVPEGGVAIYFNYITFPMILELIFIHTCIFSHHKYLPTNMINTYLHFNWSEYHKCKDDYFNYFRMNIPLYCFLMSTYQNNLIWKNSYHLLILHLNHQQPLNSIFIFFVHISTHVIHLQYLQNTDNIHYQK